ncbi:hypothetical protein J8L84_01675 [Alteromonas sp. MMG017]|uniref:hypothetical protein n=1 Tax=Alteromonas sp. MMG017 TaxID=2822692 RepID=UPI001B3A09C0|nr:hypothetical protein [Alteromonas sp. MMG017]MBQ4827984.1 hypothetical protein [Alteromonas sp. MMG017]
MKTYVVVLLVLILLSQRAVASNDGLTELNNSEIIDAALIYMRLNAKVDVDAECSAKAKKKLDQFYADYTAKEHTDERLEDYNLWGIEYFNLGRLYQVRGCQKMANITYQSAEYFANMHDDDDLHKMIRDMKAQ